MYAKLLQPSQGGSVSVRELLVQDGARLFRGTFTNWVRNSVRHSAEMSAAPSGSPSHGRPINSDVSERVTVISLTVTWNVWVCDLQWSRSGLRREKSNCKRAMRSFRGIASRRMNNNMASVHVLGNPKVVDWQQCARSTGMHMSNILSEDDEQERAVPAVDLPIQQLRRHVRLNLSTSSLSLGLSLSLVHSCSQKLNIQLKNQISSFLQFLQFLKQIN
jgi:hypothetical protein